jgi:hypothetical protein
MNTKPSLLLVALAASSCSTSRWYDVRYQPAPLEVEVAAQAVSGSQVRALVSILGVARESESEGRPRQVEMRMRFENLGSVEARVVEDGFSLVSADLVSFERVVLAPNADRSVPAGQTRTLDVAFPAPARDVDWSGLNLRFTLSFADTRVTTGGTFNHIVYAPYDPVHWHVGVGYGF